MMKVTTNLKTSVIIVVVRVMGVGERVFVNEFERQISSLATQKKVLFARVVAKGFAKETTVDPQPYYPESLDAQVRMVVRFEDVVLSNSHHRSSQNLAILLEKRHYPMDFKSTRVFN